MARPRNSFRPQYTKETHNTSSVAHIVLKGLHVLYGTASFGEKEGEK